MNFKDLEEQYQKYDLNFLTISTLITTLFITIIFNLNIDFYLRGFIIPIIIVLINYLFNLKHSKLKINKNSYILLIPIGLIILNSFLFKVDDSNKFLNIIILPVTITYFLLSLLNKNISKKLFILFVEDIPNKLFTNLNKLENIIKNKTKNNKLIYILVGVLIAIPICSLMISLLASADSYFEYFINHTIDNIFNKIDIEFIIKNIFILVISFILSFSMFINYMLKRKEVKEDVKPINIPSTIVSTILIFLNLVFCLFLITEISKLTTNFLHLPIKYTYAEYAREGFFQLLFITSINFIIITFIIYKTNLKNYKFIKALLLILIGFSCLLIFNSYYRMILYINAYTFTILRLQVILFLFLELILFILLIKKIINEIKINNLKLFSILSLIFYILNLYLANQVVVDFINKFLN